jgi:hypothetical protein
VADTTYLPIIKTSARSRHAAYQIHRPSGFAARSILDAFKELAVRAGTAVPINVGDGLRRHFMDQRSDVLSEHWNVGRLLDCHDRSGGV